MKRIINGKRYDTQTATMIAEFSASCSTRDFNYFEEALYKTKNGNYFVAGEGGPMSHYSQAIDTNSWSGGSDLRLLSPEEAQNWLEDKGFIAELEEHFSGSIVDG